MSRATINREGRRLAKNLPGRTAMRARQEIKCNDTDTRTRACAQPELPFHPLADLFPLMEGEEFAALVADIKANGLLEDIVLYEGKVLDGRNRYRACLTAGIVPRSYNCDHFVTDPAAHVISANIYRRHLTADQRRGLIHKLLAAQPEKSDRQIAEMAKASPTTVGKVRAKMEPTVQPGQLKRTGKDGKARKQPARRISAAAREQEARDRETCIALDAKVKDAERELAEARKQPDGLAEQLQAARIKIAGLESENEELKAERDRLHQSLAEAHAANLALIERLKAHVSVEPPVTFGDPGPIPESLRRDRVRS
jgi:hypothetical protein